jgi:lysophosphatidylcholine acyltransferase/lyso-PAF acetyltransferase
MEDWAHAILWVGIYMLLGAIGFEWAWHTIKPLRELNEQRDSRFKAFRRFDAPNWRRWKFYPGAVTLMPFRIFITIFLIFMCYLTVRIITIGHNFARDEPIRGCRQRAVMRAYKFYTWILMLAVNVRCSKRELDYDYSEYLGPDYKATQQLPKFVSMLVCNHSSWCDTFMLQNKFWNAFVAKKEVRYVPLMGLISQAMGCIFIARSAAQSELD